MKFPSERLQLNFAFESKQSRWRCCGFLWSLDDDDDDDDDSLERADPYKRGRERWIGAVFARTITHGCAIRARARGSEGEGPIFLAEEATERGKEEEKEREVDRPVTREVVAAVAVSRSVGSLTF